MSTSLGLTPDAPLTVSGAAAFSVADIEAGKVCMLLDALDEVGTKATFASFAEKLLEFDARYPDCKVIITARNYSYITSAEALAPYMRLQRRADWPQRSDEDHKKPRQEETARD